MHIAVDIRCLAKDDWESWEYFVNGLLQRTVQAYPQHDFLFLSDKPIVHFSAGKTLTIISPIVKGNASLKYWYDVKLAATVKKFKADVLINLSDACSLTSKIPQVLLVKDLAFVHHPKWFTKSKLFFLKIFQKKFIAKAKHIVTLSEFGKQEIIAQYKTSAEKIAVVLPTANNGFKPISFDERDAIKEEHADGREYFLFVGGTAERNNLMNVLKAFSSFKKWQQSSMKLLVTGKVDDGFVEKLKTYKYRDDITILDSLTYEHYAKLMAASYALVYPSIYDGTAVPLVEAMQAGVPVIASNTAAFPEMVADTALLVNPSEVDEIANQMKLLYRDEILRNQLIQKGLVQVEKFSWNESVEKFMKIIETAASK